MGKYLYSIVRYLPVPRTGEFVNVGAIVGDASAGDWAVRRLGSTELIRKFAPSSALEVCERFLTQIGSEVTEAQAALEAGDGPAIEADWLTRLHHDHRNIVQLSPLAPIVADNAGAALDIIFREMFIDSHEGNPVKYLVVQQIQYTGPLDAVDARVELFTDALYEHEEATPGIEDPGIVGRLSDGYLDVQMTVEAADPAEAATKSLEALRIAVQAAGTSTPGWDITRAVLHVAPAGQAERLLAEA